VERLILGSGALIALERVATHEADVLPAEADIVISAVTAAELIVGVELADDQRRPRRQVIVDGLLDRVEVVPFDLEIARHHATLLAYCRRTGQPRGAHDLQIAATARGTRRTVVTTDEHAFEGLPGVIHRLLR
jgi:tRNA(fMet)-specific endonuclease VapC